MTFDVAFAPMVPPWLLAAAAMLAVILIGYGAWRRARGIWWRAVPIAALIVAIADPRLVREERASLKDIAVVLIDESRSQDLGKTTGQRLDRARQAAAKIAEQIETAGDVEVRTVSAGRDGRGAGTRLFAPLASVLGDVPAGRLAGVVMITDGQVHDAPLPDAYDGKSAPLHVLLTGDRDEQDRRIRIDRAPDYGLIGNQALVRVTVDDQGSKAFVPVALSVNGKDAGTLSFAPGETADLPVTIAETGANIVEARVAARDGEISTRNNVSLVSVTGIRDRLRVLLISGEPHVGERAWRNLLKSDPNVDLIHFTILRPLTKDDGTPLNELALIAFPIRELFEEQLNDFDLIIFDRYSRRGLVPFQFMANISNFVRDGGAVMLAVGPEYADSFSLFDSPLRDILPGAPTGRVFDDAYRPQLSREGRRHPVTADLSGAVADNGAPDWGRWLRNVQVETSRGEQLMTGVDGQPLLILDRVGKGRVALLLSDTIWLWGKGFDGGGPQTELLRRVSHWLMKEPTLEEESLGAEVRDDHLIVTRRSLSEDPRRIRIEDPSGAAQDVVTRDIGGGRAIAALPVGDPGLYRLSDGKLETVAAVGAPDPLETYDVTTTESKLAAVVDGAKGGFYWLGENGVPAVRRVAPGRAAHGGTWLGLHTNRAYVVTGVNATTLLPAWLALMLAMGGAMMAWWREGR
jgi:hypothetical protein